MRHRVSVSLGEPGKAMLEAVAEIDRRTPADLARLFLEASLLEFQGLSTREIQRRIARLENNRRGLSLRGVAAQIEVEAGGGLPRS
jgi:hypothetical protein